MPGWLWPVLIAVVLIFLAARSYYLRFRRACRMVREELAEFVPRHYPGCSVVGERQGNLVLRTPWQDELVWDMADLYVEVARLPGMGGTPAAREQMYRAEADSLLVRPWQPGQPVDPVSHGPRLKPQLYSLADVEEEGAAGALTRPIPGLPLRVGYVLEAPGTPRPLRQAELRGLQLDEEGIHRLALENLGRDFPEEMVKSPLEGSGSAIQFGDGFDAARVLLIPSLVPEGRQLVAVIPHRDMLLLLPGDGDLSPDQIREASRELADHDHAPLLESPVRVTREGFSTL